MYMYMYMEFYNIEIVCLHNSRSGDEISKLKDNYLKHSETFRNALWYLATYFIPRGYSVMTSSAIKLQAILLPMSYTHNS